MEYFLVVIILTIICYCCFKSWKCRPRNEAREFGNMWGKWAEENKRRNEEEEL